MPFRNEGRPFGTVGTTHRDPLAACSTMHARLRHPFGPQIPLAEAHDCSVTASYKGETKTGSIPYTWAHGYEWTIHILRYRQILCCCTCLDAATGYCSPYACFAWRHIRVTPIE